MPKEGHFGEIKTNRAQMATAFAQLRKLLALENLYQCYNLEQLAYITGSPLCTIKDWEHKEIKNEPVQVIIEFKKLRRKMKALFSQYLILAKNSQTAMFLAKQVDILDYKENQKLEISNSNEDSFKRFLDYQEQKAKT